MRTDAALLVIDFQTGMFNEADPVFNGEILLSRIASVISNVRTRNVPIFFIQHNDDKGKPLEYGTPGWEIHAKIAPLEKDLIIQKHTPDSFHETTLQSELDARGIKKLFLTGIQTEICVDTTCRRAFSLGYDVTLIKDTHSTWDSLQLSATEIIQHHNGLLRWFATVVDSKDLEF